MLHPGHVSIQQEGNSLQMERGHAPEPGYAGTPVSDRQYPDQWENRCLLFKPPVNSILSRQPAD